MTRPAIVALFSAALAATFAATAWGYARAKTEDGIPIYWTSSCLPVSVYLDGFSQMTPDEVAKSVGAAAHAWSPSAVSCPAAGGGVSHPYLEIVPTMAPATAAPVVGNDGHNVVVFRSANWEMDHSIAAVAVTSLTKKRDGRILDADVEINAEYDNWANLDPGSDPTPGNGQDIPFDLQNAITHEFGHFIGLDHTCFTALSDSVRQIDDQGNPVPDCDFAPADVQATVMFATIVQNNAEVSKRFLSPDDTRAVCEIYPADNDPHTCTLDLPDDGCGCAAGGPGARGGAALLAILTLALGLALFTRGRARPGRREATARRG